MSDFVHYRPALHRVRNALYTIRDSYLRSLAAMTVKGVETRLRARKATAADRAWLDQYMTDGDGMVCYPRLTS